MNANLPAVRIFALTLVLVAALLRPDIVMAHCDGLDGPVAEAARAALANGDVSLVLVWVQEVDEAEIRQAFERTLAVRSLGRVAQELADGYFVETLVRVHRTGEGAAYTGLKPAGRDLGPAIPLADQALTSGKVDPLVQLITAEARNGLIERFAHARQAKAHAADDVAAGREYVRAYVTFVHYVERLHEAANEAAIGHFPEGLHPAAEHDD